jgi:endothelin-converting enzyme
MSQRLVVRIPDAKEPTDFPMQHSSFSPAQLVKALSSVDHDNFNKLKFAYDACMNEDVIKQEGIKPLMKILHSVVTAFPVTPSSSPNEKDIAGAIDLLARLGVSALIAFGTGPDDKDPDVVVVQVASPNPIGLPAKDYYKDDNVVQSYETTLTQVLEAIHPAGSTGNSKAFADWVHFDQIKDLAHEVVEFEKKLATASPDAEDRDDVNVSCVHDLPMILNTNSESRNTTIPCHSRTLIS